MARSGHRRRRRKTTRVLVVAGVLLAMLVASGVGYAWYLNDQVNRVAVHGLDRAPRSGPDHDSENILMIGSTSRCALAVQDPAYGLCSQGVTGVNSDVVMVLHLNPDVPSVSILSIPRDLFVPNARANGPNKIDAALYEGPSQLVSAIEEDFGIPIQHFVELNFDSFANIVNDLGGINMDFPEPVYDAYSGLDVTTVGCHHLDGVEALEVVRARHLQYRPPGDTDPDPSDWPQEAQSDLARIQRDHEFLRVLATAVAERGLSNPISDEKLISDVAGQLTVDSGLSTSDMVHMLLTYHGVKINSAPQLTLPVDVAELASYQYNDNVYGDVEFPSEPQDREVVDRFLGVSSTTDTMDGGDLPTPGDVSVSVVNGTGVDDQATQTGQALSALGFKVVGAGDATPEGQESETFVTYADRTPADEAAAQAVARSLTGQVVMAHGPTADGAEVTVTTGTDFSVSASSASSSPSTSPSTSAPPGTSTSSGTAASAAASAASASSTPAGFAAPSSATPSLTPWDPRACSSSPAKAS